MLPFYNHTRVGTRILPFPSVFYSRIKHFTPSPQAHSYILLAVSVQLMRTVYPTRGYSTISSCLLGFFTLAVANPPTPHPSTPSTLLKDLGTAGCSSVLVGLYFGGGNGMRCFCSAVQTKAMFRRHFILLSDGHVAILMCCKHNVLYSNVGMVSSS